MSCALRIPNTSSAKAERLPIQFEGLGEHHSYSNVVLQSCHRSHPVLQPRGLFYVPVSKQSDKLQSMGPSSKLTASDCLANTMSPYCAGKAIDHFPISAAQKSASDYILGDEFPLWQQKLNHWNENI